MSIYVHPKLSPQISHESIISIFTDVFGKEKRDGFFMEMGAFNGWNWSPTAPLALAGWSGIFIEPQPDLCKECKERYKDYENITTINSCVGDYEGEIDLYLNGSTSTTKVETIQDYNSIIKEGHIGWSGELNTNNKIRCKITKLDTIIHKYNIPKDFELLVIDVEGAELDVLNGINLNINKPKMIIIETHKEHEVKLLSKNANAINKRLSGYDEVFANYVNSIYVRKK